MVWDRQEYELKETPRKAFETKNIQLKLNFDFLDDDYLVRAEFKMIKILYVLRVQIQMRLIVL